MGKLIVIAWIGMFGMLGLVASAASSKPEVDVQYTQTGPAYVHGDWCTDSRVF